MRKSKFGSTGHPRGVRVSIFQFRISNWSGRRGSNPRPTAWKAVTLPLSYSRVPFRKAKFETRKSAPSSKLTIFEFRLSAPWWTGEDSNPRSSQGAAGLQPAAINHSATCPDWILPPKRHAQKAWQPSGVRRHRYRLSRKIRVCGQARRQTSAPAFLCARRLEKSAPES